MVFTKLSRYSVQSTFQKYSSEPNSFKKTTTSNSITLIIFYSVMSYFILFCYVNFCSVALKCSVLPNLVYESLSHMMFKY